MKNILDTGVKNARNVDRYIFGAGSIKNLKKIISERRKSDSGIIVFFLDSFFENKTFLLNLGFRKDLDTVFYINTNHEPTTTLVNSLKDEIFRKRLEKPSAIIGVGGGSTMDVAKGVANLITNPGSAECYQGWDLLKNPSIYKIAIPTISGTGAEATRTCVMINPKNGLKLGMNSDFSVYDQVILDPDLTASVPRDQYFFTGMDAYIHCVESLAGHYRNAIGDAFSNQTIKLCREVFLSDDMQSPKMRESLMVASFLGGCAIATSYVGLIHPFSAGLSVVLGTHHCVANCIVMMAMEEFYPKELKEFRTMVDSQKVKIPSGVCKYLNEDQLDRLFEATIVHEKPLTNALGEDYRKILSKEKVIELFKKM